MARFFVSDTHFNDDRFNLFYRPFKSIKEQEDYIVDRWNSVVSPKDIVYHVGDFATTDEGLDVAKRLNGKIHLIKGNYDDPRPHKRLKEIFESVSEFDIIKLKNGELVYVNHYPENAVDSKFNIVGHIHGLWKVQRNMINVSTDAWHFTPVSEDEIIFAMNAVKKYYDHNVFAGELTSNLNNVKGNEIYATDNIPEIGKKVFLAGPTPRSLDVESWRPEMVKILREAGYNGHILIPEKKDPSEGYDYTKQIEWEEKGLNAADIILFWVPRDLNDMPGFTTNIEFGYWMSANRKKCVLGYPYLAKKMRYMKLMATKNSVPVYHSMKEVSKYVTSFFK